MKRGRISMVADSNAKKGRTETGEVSHIQTQYSGPSFSDLPGDITVNILLRLPIKKIVVCKCTCKTWYHLISGPEFAKCHFDQAQVYPLLRALGFTSLSRLLYLVQPEKADFELKLGMCDHTDSKTGCGGRVIVKLDTKFKLPLRNIDIIFGVKDSGHNMHDPNSWAESNKCIKLKMKDHIYCIVNSCNGLLCLIDRPHKYRLIVCNPVTGEYINLPQLERASYCGVSIRCGLGFSPVTKQYKALRIFEYAPDVYENVPNIVGNVGVKVHILGTESWKDIHILGTESWKDISFFNPSIWSKFPTYVNGFLYWFSASRPLSLITFDVEKECFGIVSAPIVDQPYEFDDLSMGVLGGELCISVVSRSGVVRVWAMKNDGAEKVWSKVFSTNLYCYRRYLPYGSCQPIKYLNNGALLMFHASAFVYVDPKRSVCRCLKVRGMEPQGAEAIVHIPSFVSLKHAISGYNAKVLNLGSSRCAELKLRREAEDVYIVEEEFDSDSDSDSVSDTDSGSIQIPVFSSKTDSSVETYSGPLQSPVFSAQTDSHMDTDTDSD